MSGERSTRAEASERGRGECGWRDAAAVPMSRRAAPAPQRRAAHLESHCVDDRSAGAGDEEPRVEVAVEHIAEIGAVLRGVEHKDVRGSESNCEHDSRNI